MTIQPTHYFPARSPHTHTHTHTHKHLQHDCRVDPHCVILLRVTCDAHVRRQEPLHVVCVVVILIAPLQALADPAADGREHQEKHRYRVRVPGRSQDMAGGQAVRDGEGGCSGYEEAGVVAGTHVQRVKIRATPGVLHACAVSHKPE